MPTLAPPARRLEPADLVWATDFLAAASTDHPLLDYCCSGAQAPRQRLWLLEKLLRFGLCYGRVYANADASALAVWLGPSRRAATLGRLLRSGLLPAALWRLSWEGCRRLCRYLLATDWLRRQNAAAQQHYYLLALVVHPAVRGRGLGRRLLQATMAAMQATQAPCYLDIQRHTELAFFQRLGFRLLGQCPAGAGALAPVSWGLVREASN